MDVFTIISLSVVALIVLVAARGFIAENEITDKKKSMEEKLDALSDFSPSQKVIGIDLKSGIAVDEGRKKICLIKQIIKDIEVDLPSFQDYLSIELEVISFRDILSSEVYVDGETVTKTARSSQLGGSLLGGLVLGGVGAIIGGLSGTKTSSNKVNRIDLRITVNRTENPIHDINFMNIISEKNESVYNHTMEQVRHWHGLMEVIIKRADSEDDAKQRELTEKAPKLISTGSVADELAKLGELKKQGLLTDEEFLSQKAKLLS